MALKIKDHILVPKHVKLSKEKREKLLKKYNISLNELPKIFKTDAGIAHLKVEVGDVIGIMRPSKTSGKAAYYRVVINA